MNGHATENVIDFRAGENGDRDARHVQKGNGRSRRRKGTPRNADNLNAKPGRKPMPEKAQREARELSKALRSAIAASGLSESVVAHWCGVTKQAVQRWTDPDDVQTMPAPYLALLPPSVRMHYLGGLATHYEHVRMASEPVDERQLPLPLDAGREGGGP